MSWEFIDEKQMHAWKFENSSNESQDGYIIIIRYCYYLFYDKDLLDSNSS